MIAIILALLIEVLERQYMIKTRQDICLKK